MCALEPHHPACAQAIAAARPRPSSNPPAGAGSAPSSYVALYIEVLNHYLTYFGQGVEPFTPGVVQQLVELCESELLPEQQQRQPAGVVDEDTLR